MKLQRRPLALSSIQSIYRTADACAVNVNGEVFEYRAMVAEMYEDLLRYVSADALDAREFLFDGTGPDWDKDWVPTYTMGWPGSPKIKVRGAKAAVAAMRRYWPLRDHAGEQDQPDDSPDGEDEPQGANVVPIRESASAILRRLRRSDPDVTPGQVI